MRVCYTDDQVNAIKKFDKMKVGALFMKMGTGKTITACEIANRKPVKKVMWFCPKSLVEQTRQEVEEHLKKPFEIRWYEEISSSDAKYIEIMRKIDEDTMIIADESLKIKNPQAKRTKRMLELSKLTEYKMLLNGTPMSKHALDIYTQMAFLSPKILNMTENKFRYTFLEFWEDKPNQVVRSHNLDYLSSLIEPYVYESDLHVDKERHEYKYYTFLEPESHKKYEKFKEDILVYPSLDDLKDYEFFAIITQFQKEYMSYHEHYESLKELLQDKEIKKAIIFNKFRIEQEKIKERFENVYVINGDTKDRQGVIEAFKKSESGLLCMTYQVGSFGFNLQFCDTIIFFSHQFDYALQEQAEYRIYRLGQERDCKYYHMYIDKIGLEDMLYKCLNKKMNLNNDFKRVLNKKSGKELKEWLKKL